LVTATGALEATPKAQVDVSVKFKCLGGLVYLQTSVKNTDQTNVDVFVTGVGGSKEFLNMAPGKTSSVSINTRAATVGAGAVAYQAGFAGQERNVVDAASYLPFSCQ
jgi:hypothetical protein